MGNRKNKWAFNMLLLLSGVATSVSGVIIQFGYHFGSPDTSAKLSHTVLGINYWTWSTMHQATSTIFLLLCMWHIFIHRKLFMAILPKKALRKKNRQLLLFSLIFIISSLLGLAAWGIVLLGNLNHVRLLLIEIHDKIALLLIIFMILHTLKRAKRFA